MPDYKRKNKIKKFEKSCYIYNIYIVFFTYLCSGNEYILIYKQ